MCVLGGGVFWEVGWLVCVLGGGVAWACVVVCHRGCLGCTPGLEDREEMRGDERDVWGQRGMGRGERVVGGQQG